MIDVHILHLPHERREWRTACDESLAGEPDIAIHHLDGIPGDYFGSRRMGFAVGRLPFVSYVDPDDVILPGAFGDCLAFLHAHPLNTAVYTRSYKITYGEWLFEELHARRPHQLIVARREYVLAVLPFARSDADLWEQVAHHGPIHRLNTFGYVWRDHADGHHRVGNSETWYRHRKTQTDTTREMGGTP